MRTRKQKGPPSPITRQRAKQLRTQLTDAELKLWYHLRAHRLLGIKFKRQHPVGHYIVDFIALTHGLVIEIDGGQHQEQAEKDAGRTAFLNAQGLRVLRFWNDEVLTQTDAVLERIQRCCTEVPSSLTPLP